MPKKRTGNYQPRKENIITYNRYKPNRKARRLGIKPEKTPEQEKEEKRRAVQEIIKNSALISRKLKQIVPCGMDYPSYTGYLKKKQQEAGENMGKDRKQQ